MSRYIDADKLLEKWEQTEKELVEFSFILALQGVMNEVKSAPTADVRENVRGEWELCEDADGEYGVCSVCGTDADFSHYGLAYPFCPNCGASMT